MSGETNLEILLASMAPRLMEGEYVYCSFRDADYGDYRDLEPVAAISESEGLTLIIRRSTADAENIGYDSVYRGITLGVHSSLDAVGLTAAFSSKLAEHGISANVVAGYYHDHIFVHSDHAERAVKALDELTR